MKVVQDFFNVPDNKLIERIPIPMLENEDSWFWLLEANGQFSVKSCCRRLHGDRVYEDGKF